MYHQRMDSSLNVFNNNLGRICKLIDPEEYPDADGVIVTSFDLVRLPSLFNQNNSYRNKYQSQLWLFHSEESPRNSYRTVQMKNISELDNWFNLTATLKPESDLHIQYKGYRIKPSIVNLITNKLNLTFNMTINTTHLPQTDLFDNNSSTYFNTLISTLSNELNIRRNNYLKACPFTCNQPLPTELVNSLQPHLRTISPKVLNRDMVYIVWFVSNCNSHSRREEYVLKLRSQPGIQVDIYGDCSSMFNSHIVPVQCKKGTPDCMEKTLSNYRFYLAFENSKCDTYITEKYWMQGLNGEAIPIVLGASKQQYQRIAVPNSYIHVDDYETVEKLAEELHRLNRNDSEFTKYLQWTQLYDIGVNYSPTVRYDMYSTLCFLGHYQRLHSMKANDQQRMHLLELIRNIFRLEAVRLPNFNWSTAKSKFIRISEFYSPKIDCWDMDYPSLLTRIYNYLFLWWKIL
ncbi:unnamed protein product [Adineta ricciae]|uniref:Fucosyltransferase n=1 Tax=Adineta ricciae TaxID=249248 RepID=A0A814Y1N7_ADIRI|nr:unnamed protein product [Adineta ricciae]